MPGSRCSRCGDTFVRTDAKQFHCFRCDQEVQRIIEADKVRHQSRYSAPKDFTGRAA